VQPKLRRVFLCYVLVWFFLTICPLKAQKRIIAVHWVLNGRIAEVLDPKGLKKGMIKTGHMKGLTHSGRE
jgi:hypothetical protein